MLNKVRVGNMDDDVEHLLKATFIRKSAENYPKDALPVYAENEPAMKRNEIVLNDLRRQHCTIKAIDKILGNCKFPLGLIQAVQNQKQTNT